MSSPDRQELIQNAVAFLTGPKTQASPVSQRIQFLEAKGLTPTEIDIAMKQAAYSTPMSSPPYPGQYVLNPYAMAPLRHTWDWRDYFITAIVSGSVAYGAASLFRKYLFPYLQPPSTTAYEDDRDALTAQFDAAEALLKEIQAETAAVRIAVEEQKERIDQTTGDVKEVVTEMRESEVKTRDEMREIREEVNNIRELLPKMIEKNKDSQDKSLSELHQELKSLKALLLSRSSNPSSTSPSPMPHLGRPAIPAWQLATPPDSSQLVSGKSKESDTPQDLPTSMFTQFRTALESVAQPIRILDPASSSENSSEPASSMNPSTSSQLAESAISSLRKSFATQRVSTPDSPKSPASSSAARKSTLEERLRRATKAPAVSDLPTAKPGTVTRGRTDSSASQTTLASHSPSPATRGRSTEVSNSAAAKLPSRTASPANPPGKTASPAPVTRTSSRPPSRASSPAPASRPPSRTASPAPVTKTPSRPPSRAASPASAARARASELTKSARAASPSPITRNQSPLRRSSVALNKTPLAASSLAASSSSESSNSNPETPDTLLRDTQSDTDEDQVKDEDNEEEETTAVTPPSAEQIQKSENDDGVSVGPIDRESEIPSEGLSSQSEDETLEPPPAVDSPQKIVALAKLQLTDLVVPPTEPGIEVSASSSLSTPQQLEDTKSASGRTQPEPLPAVENDVKEESSVSVTSPFQASEPLPEPVETETVVSPNVSTSLTTPRVLSTTSEEPSILLLEAEQTNGNAITDQTVEVESLQAKLKEVEQRFSDVSTSFKRLQAEKLAADAILKENSPLESFTDPVALREYFVNLRVKDEVFQEELKRLANKIELQDDRYQELRDTHDRESQSLSGEIRKLKTQLVETDALFEAAQRATANVESAADNQKEDILRLEKEVAKAKDLAKEEEEKRVKAITLLKTVRQKLVKAEKDKEDVVKEMATFKEREKSERDKEQAERLNFVREMDLAQAAHTQEVAALKSQFEKELVAVRERHEHDINALVGQQELDTATAKSLFNKELTVKTSQISALEGSLNRVSRDKTAYFEQLQVRQAEIESAQADLESLRHHRTELEYQLRESNDRLALLREEYSELQREAETRSREPVTSADEMARMVSAVEAKYEARLTEMKRNISVLEKERHDSETDWSKKLREKVKELEDLKRLLGSATSLRENEETMVASLKAELGTVQKTNLSLQREVEELPILKERIQELQRTSVEHEHEVNMKIHVLEKQIEEHKMREAQLKQGNKTLRDELRKVQSSAALLERQRNPGVGYWGTRGITGGSGDATGNGSINEPRVSISSPSPADVPSRASSPAPSTAASTKEEEEVNLEYIRNVILQFLEHKEMRPHLVKVLSIILRFTPQETRRLIAKV